MPPAKKVPPMSLGDVGYLGIGKGVVEFNLGNRHRPLEEVSLQRGNAGQSQQSALIIGFHAFSRGRYVECAGKRERRGNDGSAICALGQVLGERFVDFDSVERKHCQVAQ